MMRSSISQSRVRALSCAHGCSTSGRVTSRRIVPSCRLSTSGNTNQLSRTTNGPKTAALAKPQSPKLTKKIHGSAAKQHSSTTSMDFTHSAPSIISKAECEQAAYPSVMNLRALFIASAIPMVGFGAMDNIVSLSLQKSCCWRLGSSSES
jgi:hypothetical protein